MHHVGRPLQGRVFLAESSDNTSMTVDFKIKFDGFHLVRLDNRPNASPNPCETVPTASGDPFRVARSISTRASTNSNLGVVCTPTFQS